MTLCSDEKTELQSSKHEEMKVLNISFYSGRKRSETLFDLSTDAFRSRSRVKVQKVIFHPIFGQLVQAVVITMVHCSCMTSECCGGGG